MIFFLDRDGTINIDHNFVHLPQEWDFCDGAPEAIRTLNRLGFKVVVVTNQSGIIRQRFTLAKVMNLHRHVDQELAKHGAHIDAWYIAPWHPDRHTVLDPRLLHDRKPQTGMFERALLRFHGEFQADVNPPGDFPVSSSTPKPDILLTKNELRQLSQPPARSTPEIPSDLRPFLAEPLAEAQHAQNTTDIFERLHQPIKLPSNASSIFAQCFMAGDKITDLEPALKLGIKPFFIKSVWFSEKDSEWLEKNNIPVFERLIDVVNTLK